MEATFLVPARPFHPCHVHETASYWSCRGVTLSVNVFDQEEYLGCLTVFEAFRPLGIPDRSLAVFLAAPAAGDPANPCAANPVRVAAHCAALPLPGSRSILMRRRQSENERRTGSASGLQPKSGVPAARRVSVRRAGGTHPGAMAWPSAPSPQPPASPQARSARDHSAEAVAASFATGSV